MSVSQYIQNGLILLLSMIIAMVVVMLANWYYRKYVKSKIDKKAIDPVQFIAETLHPNCKCVVRTLSKEQEIIDKYHQYMRDRYLEPKIIYLGSEDVKALQEEMADYMNNTEVKKGRIHRYLQMEVIIVDRERYIEFGVSTILHSE